MGGGRVVSHCWLEGVSKTAATLQLLRLAGNEFCVGTMRTLSLCTGPWPLARARDGNQPPALPS